MGDRPRVRFGPFELDPTTFKLLKGGSPLQIEPKALDVLQVLAERAPRVVDKAEIFSLVWKDVAVTDNALTRVVAHLRKVLDDDPKAPRYIETVATRGYRFAADVDVVPPRSALPVASVGPAAAPPPAPATPAASVASPRRARAVVVVAALVLGAAALAGLSLVRTGWSSRIAQSGPDGAPDLEAWATLRPEQLTSGTGFDGFLTFSPDGQSLAYASDRSGAFEIYVQGIAPGSTPVALTNNGRHNVQPVWSPDGQFIAYHEMTGNGIWVIPSRGGIARKLSDFGSCPSWSPDGHQVAFQSLPPAEMTLTGIPGVLSTIWVVDADGRTQPRQLTSPGKPAGPHLEPVWRLDGREIYFGAPGGIVPSEQSTDLWSVDVESRQFRHVSTERTLSTVFALAPSGRGIYYVARGANAIWWLPLDERGEAAGEPHPTGLPIGGAVISHLSVSADGRRVAWTALDSDSHVWATNTDPLEPATSSTAAPLTQGLGVRYYSSTPASDGRLALTGIRAGSFASLFLLAPGAPLRQLTFHPPHHAGPRWMPGEREIAFVTDHGEGSAFWALDPDTGRERRLFLLSELPMPSGDSQPSTASPSTGIAITADFTRLAMAVVRDGVLNLWVAGLRDLRPDGSLAQATFEREGGSYPAWSPDGRWIAYQCNEGTDTHICVTSPGSGKRQQLTHEAGQSWVGGWEPDNDTILFAARRDAVWNIAAVSRGSSEVRMLTRFTEPRMYVRYPRWDSANRRVVFDRSETTGRIFGVQLP